MSDSEHQSDNNTSQAEASSADKKPMEFTDPEKRFLENMWVGFKTTPEIDMAKVAARMGMQPRSCGNIWGKLKTKIAHNISIDNLGGGAPIDPNTPGTPKRKRGGAAVKQETGEDGGSPAKKARAPPRKPRGGKAAAAGKGKAKSSAVVVEDSDEDDDEEMSDVKSADDASSPVTRTKSESE